MKRTSLVAAVLTAMPSFIACSSDSNSNGAPPSSSGGGGATASSGGASATGGTPASNGGAASGGSPANGGTTASNGGAAITGGRAGAAGTTSVSGGASGATSGGGTTASGGASGNSGTTGSGGTSAIGGAAGGGASGGGGYVGGLDPIIPDISGDCPMFKAGTSTVTVMGSSATVIAGAQKQGTGSLLFYFYGTGKLGDVSFLPQAVKDDVAAQGGIVFALNQSKGTGGDCSGTGTWGIDDFKVTDQVVACAVKNYGIDPKRIYATGCSAGGLFTGCMGIMRSKYIAAVAPNSGGVTIGYGKLEDPTRVPSAITMNGGAGDNVIVNFGQTSEAYDNYILHYGGFAVNCIHNMGHCGAPAALYMSAWQFLKDHPFGTKPSPYANGLPSGFDPSCKVFTMTSMMPLGGF
jgi:hypothetical protein